MDQSNTLKLLDDIAYHVFPGVDCLHERNALTDALVLLVAVAKREAICDQIKAIDLTATSIAEAKRKTR